MNIVQFQGGVIRTSTWSTSDCSALTRSRRTNLKCLASANLKSSSDKRDLDLRYKRQDMSLKHTYEARRAFAECIRLGEARTNLAEAALHVAAEDDAIVSHSAVRFPTEAYLARVSKMVDELARLRLPAIGPAGAGDPSAVLEAVDRYLFEEQRLRVPSSGRSALPSAATVASPGVWEEPRHAYLNEALTRRVASPACLAILYAEIMQRLLERGAVDFAVRMECKTFDELPRAVVLPGLDRASLAAPGGGLLNTCTWDALVEVLVHLKRAYWPFAWDSGYTEGGARSPSYGGFDDAARAAVDGMQSAEMEAIARTAAHRLSRGIWTSPGAGDLRRARAAAERICMLVGDERPSERRDLAVLLAHCGEFGRAAAELKAYLSTPAAEEAPAETRVLAKRLMEMLEGVPGAASDAEAISVKSVLGTPPPAEEADGLQELPW
uniref:Protein SirB1 N-terminal domain-containing protein n=2 Tax=Tetraselmis sp. GSL018 TaxID=582737 RepID=A0A061QMV1_9CHLO